MFTKKEIEEARKEQKILNNRSHLVGRSAVATIKNKGKVHVPSKVFEYFVNGHADGRKRYAEATKSHNQNKSK